ncbi:MAG: transporter substrate-binding domain-containing protein [Fibrobacter sp.]|nr:transporter substrate-binding domain-containing protein [Fibrobacter sp.]
MSKCSFLSLVFMGILVACFCGCKEQSKEPLTSVFQANSPRYTIGVEDFSTVGKSVARVLPKAQIKKYPDLVAAYFALQMGDIDAIAYNENILSHTFDSTSGLQVIHEDAGISEELVIGMNRHSPIPNLKGIINAIIDSLNAAGTLLELHQHWSEKKNPLIEDNEIESANILRIATSADVPPFSFIENNKIIGLDIDLVRLLKKRLNIKTEIVRTERDKLIEALKSNKADLIISAFGKTDCIENDIDFSKPYHIGKIAFAVRQNNSSANHKKNISQTNKFEQQKQQDIYSLNDLSGKYIGVQTGTTLDEQVHQIIKLPRVQYFSNIVEMTKSLEQRKIDAAAMDLTVAETILMHHSDFSILEERLNKDEFGIAMRKRSPLKPIIDSCITILQINGEIQKIKEKWLKSKVVVKAIPQDWEATDTLIVGTEALYAPYEFYQGGELAGIDVDIMLSIAKMLNKHIKFADMNFDVLIPSLVNEKTDLCIAAMSITEERNNLIDFSTPYDRNESVVVVRTPKSPTPGKIKDTINFFSKLFQNIRNWFN